jgi:integrase/recombinase XerD
LVLEFIEYLGGGIEPEEVTPNDIRRYLLRAKQLGHNPGGQHIRFKVLKTFFRWLHAEEVIPTDIFRRIKAPKLNSPLLPPAQLDDIRQLIKAAGGPNKTRDSAILLTLLDTGIRAKELCDLEVSDVDLQTGEVTIRAGKGGKRRTVFVSARTRRELQRYWRARARINTELAILPAFATQMGHKLTYSGLRQIVRRLSEKAGISEIPLHAFRRAFAINSLRNGVDLLRLQRLMGHASLATTARYLRFETEDLRKAHEAGSPVSRL